MPTVTVPVADDAYINTIAGVETFWEDVNSLPTSASSSAYGIIDTSYFIFDTRNATTGIPSAAKITAVRYFFYIDSVTTNGPETFILNFGTNSLGSDIISTAASDFFAASEIWRGFIGDVGLPGPTGWIQINALTSDLLRTDYTSVAWFTEAASAPGGNMYVAGQNYSSGVNAAYMEIDWRVFSLPILGVGQFAARIRARLVTMPQIFPEPIQTLHDYIHFFGVASLQCVYLENALRRCLRDIRRVNLEWPVTHETLAGMNTLFNKAPFGGLITEFEKLGGPPELLATLRSVRDDRNRMLHDVYFMSDIETGTIPLDPVRARTLELKDLADRAKGRMDAVTKFGWSVLERLAELYQQHLGYDGAARELERLRETVRNYPDA